MVEVEISLYDCVLRTAPVQRHPGEGGHGIAYANITISAKVLCDLLNYPWIFFTVESLDALEPKLEGIADKSSMIPCCAI